jgi:hypothetical protein
MIGLRRRAEAIAYEAMQAIISLASACRSV